MPRLLSVWHSNCFYHLNRHVLGDEKQIKYRDMSAAGAMFEHQWRMQLAAESKEQGVLLERR